MDTIPTKLTEDLEVVVGWLKQNQLRLNPSITEIWWLSETVQNWDTGSQLLTARP